jgi:hypothetical protein
MAEVAGIMFRQKPKQVFSIFVTWNLSALWRRIKKFQKPWAPFNPPRNLEVPINTTIEISRSTEKYLRPSSEINPYQPEVIALAVTLGLKEKSKEDYARAVYAYTKNYIYFSMENPPTGPVEVLKKGYGLCFSKMSVLAALTRLAGIPTRFVSYKQEMAGGFIQMMAEEAIGAEDIAQELEKSKPTFTHGCVEIFLNDKWLPMDITWTDEEEVGMDMPITQFGESPFGKWYHIIPESITRDENPPPLSKIKYQIAISTFLLRGLYDRLNKRFNNIREIGRQKLNEIGIETYIEQKKKFYVPPPPLIFDEND